MTERQSRGAKPQSHGNDADATSKTPKPVQAVDTSRAMSAQRQRLERAFGAVAQLASALPPGAVVQRAVGFEFQMLNSKVDLQRQGAKGFNSTQKLAWRDEEDWHIERDGDNIEFVLAPVKDAKAAHTVVSKVAKVGATIGKAGTKADGGKSRIVVETPDTGGQPQVNADIGLDQFIAGSPGFGADDKANKTYFGAESKEFSWSYEQTKTMMGRIGLIKAKMATYSRDDLLDHLQLAVDDENIPVSFARGTELDQVLKLMRAYCVLEASILSTAPASKGLTKDMPMLPKTNIASMEAAMQTLLREGLRQDAQHRVNAEKINGMRLREFFPRIIAELRQASGANREGSDFYETTRRSRHVYGVKDPKEVNADRGYSLLMEYRRVPVLPVEKWVDFAEKAATALGKQDE